MNQEGRINYFDWIRGTMIMWMLIYHISLNYGRVTFAVPEDGASAFTFMSFFMATFYVNTGYFFSYKKDFLTFFRDKVRKIGIPYITFSIWGIIIFELYNLISEGYFRDLNLIGGTIATGAIRANGPLWFLFSLFFCNLIYYAIGKAGGVDLRRT
ncbi:MAG: acyltransferase family protein [Bacteroidales bacterium]|nr:acyltransferase family protein [Bacteroidales bacterium]